MFVEDIKKLLLSLEDGDTKKKMSEILSVDSVHVGEIVTKIRLSMDAKFANKKQSFTKMIEVALHAKGVEAFVTIVLQNIEQKNIKEIIPKDVFKKFKNIIAVHSAKGGVGKSTIAAQLAVQMSHLGYKIALLDLDLYGPSIPRMLKIQGPIMVQNNKFLPKEIYGIDVMSIAFLLPKIDTPLIWRAPIVNGVIQQMFVDTEWPESDLLIIDMPPGTGDIPILVAQSVPLEGLILVSTQNAISLDDTFKGISMFTKFQIPIIGLIYNMSSIVCKECNQTNLLFSETNEFKEYFQKYALEILATLPMNESICNNFQNIDADTAWGKEFYKIIESLKKFLMSREI